MSRIPDNTDTILGKISGRTFINRFSERESINTTVLGEDIWRGNELTPAPTSHVLIPTPAAAGEQMSVVSESVNDASAGTGIRTLRIEYLDAAGDEQTEDVILNGTTVVNTTATDIRFVQNMYALTVGSLKASAGIIKIHKTGTVGLVYSMIQAGFNNSTLSHYMVPRNRELVIQGWHVSEAQAKRVAVYIRSTDTNGVLLSGIFNSKNVVYIKQTSSPSMILGYKIPALSIIKVSCYSSIAGAEVSTNWWGELFVMHP